MPPMPPERKEKEVVAHTPTSTERRIDTINRYLPWDAPGKAEITRAVIVGDELRDRLLEMSQAFHENSKHPGSFFDCGSDVCEENYKTIDKADGK